MFFIRSKPKKVEEKIEYVRTENPLLRPKKKETTLLNAEVVSEVPAPTPVPTPVSTHASTPAAPVDSAKDTVPKEIESQVEFSTSGNINSFAKDDSSKLVESKSPIQSTSDGINSENNAGKPKRQ